MTVLWLGDRLIHLLHLRRRQLSSVLAKERLALASVSLLRSQSSLRTQALEIIAHRVVYMRPAVCFEPLHQTRQPRHHMLLGGDDLPFQFLSLLQSPYQTQIP